MVSVLLFFSTEAASFMNDCHRGHDSGVPSGTHNPALINFSSKRDSELSEKRVRRKDKLASFLCLPLLYTVTTLGSYSCP